MTLQDIKIIFKYDLYFLKLNEINLLSQVFCLDNIYIWTGDPTNVERALTNLGRVVKVFSFISYHSSFQFVELNFRRTLVTSADNLKKNTNNW